MLGVSVLSHRNLHALPHLAIQLFQVSSFCPSDSDPDPDSDFHFDSHLAKLRCAPPVRSLAFADNNTAALSIPFTMMDYHKHYPSPSTSTYPLHTLSTPAHGPRFPPPLPSVPPAPHSVSVAVTVAGAPPPQPPAPPPSGPSSLSGSPLPSYSQSHRPLRPSNGPIDQSQLDMPRSTPPSAAYNYHHPPPDGTPAVTLYSAENGYAPLRRRDSMYHVSQANHSSRKKPHREDVFQGAWPRLDANSGPRYRNDRERLSVHREGKLFTVPSF